MFQSFLRTLRLGFFSLLLHKLRSGLAVLGILIGITAVIWLVALGEGVSYEAQQQIKDLGANNVIVRSVKPPQQSSQGARRGMFIAYGVLREDFRRIVSNLPMLQNAVPMREIRREVRFNDRLVEVHVGDAIERNRHSTATDHAALIGNPLIGDGEAGNCQRCKEEYSRCSSQQS